MASRAADSIQFAIFTEGNPSLTASAAWKRVFGAEPPASQTIPGGAGTASGEQSGLAVELQVQPGRVDLILNPPGMVQPSPVPPVIPDGEAALDVGLAWIKKAMPAGKIARVAIVVTRSEPASSSEEAVRQLSKKLPLVPVPRDAADLLYQVNSRVRSSVVRALTINRMCRWNTGAKIGFSLQLGTFNSVPVKHIVTSEMFDINTVEGGRIPQQKVPSVFDEIHEILKNLLRDGYNAIA